MAGIYIHIPFCRQACTYCNFHFTTSLRYKEELVEAIVMEANQEKEYLQQQLVHTIYFGGGTPSLLNATELERLIGTFKKQFPVSADAEITLEANPDDINHEILLAWKELGINRLSIGVQSFYEEELRWMNRAHNAEQALQNLALARSVFDNITMDLIYGSPLLTDEMWQHNVNTALALDIPHLSCYALTVEEKTPLEKRIRQQQSLNVDDEKQSRQFLLLMQWLKEKGYDHYEVSNFAKPGFRSRHNSAYWKGEAYLGLGPSAHSYNGVERRWNVANNAVYMRSVQEGRAERGAETLSTSERINEAIMISLRTQEGLDLTNIEQQFGEAERKRLEKQLPKYVQLSWVQQSQNTYTLTDEGMLRADGVAAALFV
jgi:oxygen-independent coproporphyrinogen-3 oxidase